MQVRKNVINHTMNYNFELSIQLEFIAAVEELPDPILLASTSSNNNSNSSGTPQLSPRQKKSDLMVDLPKTEDNKGTNNNNNNNNNTTTNTPLANSTNNSSSSTNNTNNNNGTSSNTNKKDLELCFRIIEISTKVHIFKAPTKYEKKSWIQDIQKAVDTLTNNPQKK